MPTVAVTHIQATAPGPPISIAVATPPMLPLPTVEASAVESAWNGVMVPSPCSVRLPNAPAMTKRTASGNRRTCTSPVASVTRPPTRTSTSGIANGCQTKPSTVCMPSVSVFTAASPPAERQNMA